MKVLRRKGFTLVETMIGLVVFMILVGMVMSVIFVCLNVFGRNANIDNAQIIGNGVYDYLKGKLQYATMLGASTSADNSDIDYGDITPDCIMLSRGGGVIRYMGTSVFDADYLSGVKVRVDISSDQPEYPNMVVLSVKVIDENDGIAGDKSLYQRSGEFVLLNFDGMAIDKTYSNVYGDIYLTYIAG